MKFKIHTSNRLQKCCKVNLKKGTVCIFMSPVFKLCRERSFLGGDQSQKLRESRNKTSFLLKKKKQSKSNISTRIQLSRRFFKLTLKVLILIELWKIFFLVDTPHRSEEFCLQWSFVPVAWSHNQNPSSLAWGPEVAPAASFTPSTCQLSK